MNNENSNITPQWNSFHYNKNLKQSEGPAQPQAINEEPEERFSHASNLSNLSPSKSNVSTKERKALGSAPKAVGSAIIGGAATETDPFGGNIPIRKKVSNRIDLELESRGSIFSGRDEKSILVRKRNIQQQHMREELLRQIEEKK